MLRRLPLLVALLLLTSAAHALANTRYDPRLRFRTISTERFDIHFHQGTDASARRLAAMVEEIAAKVDADIGPPRGRVQVILVDQTDLSNGWATPLPYNTIELALVPPGGESVIGNTDDWLRLVFTHEYTHIAHLARARGLFAGLQRVVGRHPALFPNVFQPLWQIEGVATWQESVHTGLGRVPAGDFRHILNRAAAEGRFDQLDRANGGLVDWPGGNAPYLYGAYFHEFLARRYGAASLKRLTETTAGRFPYFGATAYRKVFGRSLGDLWKEFAADSARSPARLASPATRITHHGFNVYGPRFGADGELFYSISNPHGFPALMAVRPGSEPRTVATRFLGSRIGMAGGALVVDQLELVRNVALLSDLYLVDPNSGATSRLTRELRAGEPDVSPDGTTIACTIQRADRRELALISISANRLAGDPRTLRSEPLTVYNAPRWSPDGRRIVAERRTVGSRSEIVLIDAVSGTVTQLSASDRGRNIAPAWAKDGTAILFASTRAGGPFQIYWADVASRTLRQLDTGGVSAESPELSPDGRSLAFVGYTPDGYDLFLLPLADARWIPATADAPSMPALAVDTTALVDAPSYSPWHTLLPRFWTPTIESDADELVIGAATGSLDALGRHAYAVEAGWSSRARPDWQAAYAYDRWLPTIFAGISDDTDPFRGGELRSREMQAGFTLPMRRVRWATTTLVALHGERDELSCPGGGCELEAETFRRGSLRLGWLVTSAKSYGYSISAEEGASASTTVELTREALASDGNAGAATIDARWYRRLFGTHAALAVRGAGARAWGDEPVRRIFSAAGTGPQPLGFGFGLDAIGLVRGIDEDDLFGSRALVANVDLRLPLARVDRGIGTLPFFVRVLHGAVFVDAGHAWDDTFRGNDISYALGAELSADTVVGYALPLTFTAGAAWRTTADDQRGWKVFGRIGRAF
jgi:Tol biopolymer transport system component